MLRTCLKSVWYSLCVIYMALIGIIPCFLAAGINPLWKSQNGWTRLWWSSEGHQKCLQIHGRWEWLQMVRSATEIMFSLFSTGRNLWGDWRCRKTFFSAGACTVNHGLVPSGHFPPFINNFLSPSKYIMLAVGCWRSFSQWIYGLLWVIHNSIGARLWRTDTQILLSQLEPL